VEVALPSTSRDAETFWFHLSSFCYISPMREAGGFQSSVQPGAQPPRFSGRCLEETLREPP
jgi:hypothetical protein